jgi:CelD/BcsL family acetyltransferase involved in cellulose biosynthesis
MTIEWVRDVAAIRDDWSRLAEASGNVFSTPEWSEAWLRHLGGGQEPWVAVARDGEGSATAIVPLTVRRERGLRTAGLLGAGPADELAPICAPDDVGLAADAFREALHERGRDWSLFVGATMPTGWGERLGGEVREREASPVLELDGLGFDEFLAARSKNFREQVRRRERKLAREHELGFRMTTDPDRLDDDLDTLIALHDARWGGTTATFAGPLGKFHRDFARAALERGWLRLWIADLDGRPAAAWYGLRYGGDEWFYQSGRDPELERTSVGFVLLSHTVREAANDGVRNYRLLRGDEGYKGRWATDDPGLETVVLVRGPVGRAALAAAKLRGEIARRRATRKPSP